MISPSRERLLSDIVELTAKGIVCFWVVQRVQAKP